jgi:hypothetical protein
MRRRTKEDRGSILRGEERSGHNERHGVIGVKVRVDEWEKKQDAGEPGSFLEEDFIPSRAQ